MPIVAAISNVGRPAAIVRASNIPYDCGKFLVLPEERENLMRRKLAEPAFLERFDLDRWQMIFYTKLDEYWESVRRRSKIEPASFGEVVSVRGTVDVAGVMRLFDLG